MILRSVTGGNKYKASCQQPFFLGMSTSLSLLWGVAVSFPMVVFYRKWKLV